MKFGSTIVLFISMLCPLAWAKPPHYVFILPPDYVGWVQVIFGDVGAPSLPYKKRILTVEVSDSGAVRTKNLPVWFSTRNEFFYRSKDQRGAEHLVPLPAGYVLDCAGQGGFVVSGTPDGSPGSASWFFFIGPSRLGIRPRWLTLGRRKDTVGRCRLLLFIQNQAG